MSVISETTGETAKPNVIKSLPISKAGTQKVSKRASTIQPLGRKTSSVQPDMNGHHSAFDSMPPPSISRSSVPDYSEFKAWAQEVIGNQQRDIDRVSNTLHHIEGEMQTFRDFMTEVRLELAANLEPRQNLLQDRDDLIKVSGELRKLQNHVEAMDNAEVRGISGESLSRDIEIIISDMLQVSEKAHEVDGLKAEFQQLKSQVAGIAESTNPAPISNEIEDLRLELRTLQSRLKLAEEAVDQGPPPPTVPTVPEAVSEKPSPMTSTILNTIPKNSPPITSTVPGAISKTAPLKVTRAILQAEKRHPRVEIPVRREHLKPQGGQDLQVEQEIQARSETDRVESPVLPIEVPEDIPQDSSSKRKHNEFEQSSVNPNEPISEPVPPRKRRKISQKSQIDISLRNTENEPHVRFQSPRREVIEIPSFEREASPILGDYTENYAMDDVDVDYQPASKRTLQSTATLSSNTSEGRPKRQSLRRTASMSNLSTQASATLDDLPDLEPRKPRRRPSLNIVHKRDAEGNIIKPSGEVDKRSLRFKNAEKRDEIPIRDSEGNLLTSSGKIDRRSLRYKNGNERERTPVRDSQGRLITSTGKVDKRSLRFRKDNDENESETPSQANPNASNGSLQGDGPTSQGPPSEASPSVRAQISNSESSTGRKGAASGSRRRPSGAHSSRSTATDGEPSENALVPSIERDELNEIAPNAANSAPARPFKCKTCGNGFTSGAALAYVSIYLQDT
jgi:hypothetical protein